MRKSELDAALKEAGRISGEHEFLLIGSQAIHVCCRRPPAEVLLSQECDLYPRNRPAVAHLLHLQLGRGSRFARRNGFYVDVVSPEIANLPIGWEKRLKVFSAGNVKAYCLEVHDLIVSKLSAGRLKDLEFIAALLKRRLAALTTLRHRIARFPIRDGRRVLERRLNAVLEELGQAYRSPSRRLASR